MRAHSRATAAASRPVAMKPPTSKSTEPVSRTARAAPSEQRPGRLAEVARALFVVGHESVGGLAYELGHPRHHRAGRSRRRDGRWLRIEERLEARDR
jgi:hypothetical protein